MAEGSAEDHMAAVDLGAVVVRAPLKHAKLSAGDIGTVVMGDVIQAGNKMNPARQAAIHGGIPVDVPAMTVKPRLRLERTSDRERGAAVKQALDCAPIASASRSTRPLPRSQLRWDRCIEATNKVLISQDASRQTDAA